MKKILITGATGFVGKHLIEFLSKNNQTSILATYISDSPKSSSGNVRFIQIDLLNEQEVDDLISEYEPDEIYHLAALSSASNSFDSPKDTLVNNIVAELNLLEALRKNKLNTRILIVSSAEIYGNVEEKDLPINESTQIKPTSPYAVSKLTQDYLALQYFYSYNIKAIRVRPFNHIGPGQSENFVVSAFAKKIAEIEKNGDKHDLEVGNLESKRDFTDVRDVVVAYDLLMKKGVPGEAYNIGSGESHKIGDILNSLLSLSKVEIHIKQNRSLFRPFDNPNLVCDLTKIKKVTGWEPMIPLKKTLKDTLDYWRNII